MKKIKVEDAVGMLLAHDITRIVPGRFKGAVFKKGRKIRKQDIPALLKLGKEHLYVLDLPRNRLHEDEAALRIARAVCDDTVRRTVPCEGKSSIISRKEGLLKIQVSALARVNNLGMISLATLKNNTVCKAGQTVAATRIIPLTIGKNKIERLEKLVEQSGPVIRVLPFRKFKVGGVVTGSEIYKGLIPDGFDQHVGRKITEYGSRVAAKIITPDDSLEIAGAIRKLIDLGCNLIITTGGLSVDPDDLTRSGIKAAGARIVSYGSPILPGAMFLYALIGPVPVLGLPACVYYHRATVFDLMLPRVLAGDAITRREIARMGHGGLCLNCAECRFPVCTFGR